MLLLSFRVYLKWPTKPSSLHNGVHANLLEGHLEAKTFCVARSVPSLLVAIAAAVSRFPHFGYISSS